MSKCPHQEVKVTAWKCDQIWDLYQSVTENFLRDEILEPFFVRTYVRYSVSYCPTSLSNDSLTWSCIDAIWFLISFFFSGTVETVYADILHQETDKLSLLLPLATPTLITGMVSPCVLHPVSVTGTHATAWLRHCRPVLGKNLLASLWAIDIHVLEFIVAVPYAIYRTDIQIHQPNRNACMYVHRARTDGQCDYYISRNWMRNGVRIDHQLANGIGGDGGTSSTSVYKLFKFIRM